MRYSVIDRLVGIASILVGLALLVHDIREYVIFEYLSEYVSYLSGGKVIEVRVTQWIYWFFLAWSGYLLLRKNPLSWHAYQLTGVMMVTERLLVYLWVGGFYIEPIVSELMVPIVGATPIFLYTSRASFPNRIPLDLNSRIFCWVIMFGISVVTTLLPKVRFAFYILIS